MIKNLKAYPSLDSLGSDAINIKVITHKGSYYASAPARGLGRLLAIFSSIRPNFIGLDESDWISLDELLQELVGGEKSLSIAASLAFASSGFENDIWRLGENRDFPFPLANVISNRTNEFFIIPQAAKSPEKAINTCLEAYNAILEEMGKEKKLLGRSPDGSWFCDLDLLKTLEFLQSLAEDWDLRIGVDFSAERLWNGKTYKIGPKGLAPSGYMDFLEEISFTYKIYYLEDPFHSEDFQSFSELTSRLKVKLVAGNGLYKANLERLENGIELKSGNGIVIRPVQAGTLSEIIDMSAIARKGRFIPIISQSQRETGDSWLADLAILCNAPLMKIGLSGIERLSKLNRLMELWCEIPAAKMSRLP